jgi:hypothetical protein
MVRYYVCARCGHKWNEQHTTTAQDDADSTRGSGGCLDPKKGQTRVCNSEQRPAHVVAYSDAMQISSWKAQIGAAWFVLIVLAGYGAGMTSMTSWMLVAAVAMTLPVILMRFGRRSEPSMSESIRDVLR